MWGVLLEDNRLGDYFLKLSLEKEASSIASASSLMFGVLSFLLTSCGFKMITFLTELISISNPARINLGIASSL